MWWIISKVGAVDGPSEAVVKKAQVCILSLSPPKKEGHIYGCQFTVHPTCQIQIIQLPEYEFHTMTFVDIYRNIYQTLVLANSQSNIPPARDNCHDNAHAIFHTFLQT